MYFPLIGIDNTLFIIKERQKNVALFLFCCCIWLQHIESILMCSCACILSWKLLSGFWAQKIPDPLFVTIVCGPLTDILHGIWISLDWQCTLFRWALRCISIQWHFLICLGNRIRHVNGTPSPITAGKKEGTKCNRKWHCTLDGLPQVHVNGALEVSFRSALNKNWAR